jgi:hypothetical protein
MPIKKVTPEEQAIRDAQDKRVSDYLKEGKTIEEARALVEAAKALSNDQN